MNLLFCLSAKLRSRFDLLETFLNWKIKVFTGFPPKYRSGRWKEDIWNIQITLFRFLGKKWKCGNFYSFKKPSFSLPPLNGRQFPAAPSVFDAEKRDRSVGEIFPYVKLTFFISYIWKLRCTKHNVVMNVITKSRNSHRHIFLLDHLSLMLILIALEVIYGGLNMNLTCRILLPF